MAKVEKTAVVLLAIGLAFAFLGLDGGAILTLVAGFGLTCLYAIFGFALLNGIRGRQVFSGAAYATRSALALIVGAYCGIALATAALAVVFGVLRWAGADALRAAALVSLALVVGAVLLLRARAGLANGGRGWLVRAAVASAVVVAVAWVPAPPPAADAVSGRALPPAARR